MVKLASVTHPGSNHLTATQLEVELTITIGCKFDALTKPL